MHIGCANKFSLCAAGNPDRRGGTLLADILAPFGSLVRVLCEDVSEERAAATAGKLRADLHLKPETGVTILGPAPAPLSRLRRRFRYHLLLKSRRRDSLHEVAATIAALKPRWSTTKVIIDVDPQNLL